VNIQVLL